MSEKVETLIIPEAPSPIGPYSHMTKARGFITISGTAGVNPLTNELAGSDIYSQVQQILEIFRLMLESAGSDLNHVLHINVFLKDIRDFVNFNQAYIEKMGNHKPARTVVEVSNLPKPGALLIMNLTAVEKG